MKRRNLLVKLRICGAVFLLLSASLAVTHADQTVSSVQRTLKDQGFYYGSVTGQINSDTTAAIRRYQIRNGLQITGEIDAETLRSLGMGSARNSTSAPTESTPAETRRDDSKSTQQSAPVSPPTAASQEDDTPGPRELKPETSDVFLGTPYEMAPPDLQRHVIVGAQTLLARGRFYQSGIDGVFGPGTAAAVRTFQARVGLPADGRLNMETLSALGLLPGQHRPRIYPRRRPLLHQPVYRGEWIPD